MIYVTVLPWPLGTPRDTLVHPAGCSSQVHSTPFDGSAESGPTQVTSEIAEDRVIDPSLKIASRRVSSERFFFPTSERFLVGGFKHLDYAP